MSKLRLMRSSISDTLAFSLLDLCILADSLRSSSLFLFVSIAIGDALTIRC